MITFEEILKELNQLALDAKNLSVKIAGLHLKVKEALEDYDYWNKVRSWKDIDSFLGE